MGSMTQQTKRAQWIRKAAELFGMTAHLERRDRDRLRADFRAVLTGSFGRVEARGIDASRRGVGLVSSEAIEPGTLAFLRLADLGLAGFAYVRRSAPRAEGGFTLGLEFRGELSRERLEPGVWQFERRSH